MPREYRNINDSPILIKAEEYAYKKWNFEKGEGGWEDMNRNLFDVVDDSTDDYLEGHKEAINSIDWDKIYQDFYEKHRENHVIISYKQEVAWFKEQIENQLKQ